ncbi:MAG: diguanylate cyclase, partial [Bacillota bacterium]|nr:diguanylate cyclase [Bacillota bacterium]
MKNEVRKLYIIVSIVFVVIALGLFVQFNLFYKTLMGETQIFTASLRDSIGRDISNDLLCKGQVITDASDYISLERWDNEDLLGYVKRLTTNNPSFSSIYFGSTNNVMINGSGWVPDPTFDLRTRPWYIEAVKERKLIFTEVFLNASKDKLIITIAKPVYNLNNQLLGVIAGDVSIKDIVSLVKDKKITGRGYSFLIDGKGNILAHPNYNYEPTSELKNVNEISKELPIYLSKNKPGMTKISLDGTDGYLAYQSVENTNLKIGSFIPINEYISKDLIFLRIFLITLISSLFVFLLFLWQQKKYLISPLLTLSADIQKIDIEQNRAFRLPSKENEPFAVLRKPINVVLNKTQELFERVELEEQKLTRTNKELESYNLQLTASKETLKAQYKQIMDSEYTFRTLFEGSADAIAIFSDNKLIDCNSAMVELLGYTSKESLIGESSQKLSPKIQPDGISSFERIREINKSTSENGKYKFEWWYQKYDATLLPVEVMLTPILLNGRKVFHALSRDVSERKKMEQQLKYLSYHDQLTGQYNRRFFEEELKRLDVEGNYPITIVIADVNGLKLVNDSFGHAIGDELIKKVAEVIEKGCRADDLIARLGGDEFVILLPKTTSYETEKIVKRIKGEALKEKLGSIEISVSFGWETKDKAYEKTLDILKKAEDHMYKNKLFESPSMRGKTIKTIINTLHEKNKREEQHSYRVSLLCKRMGEVLGLS